MDYIYPRIYVIDDHLQLRLFNPREKPIHNRQKLQISFSVSQRIPVEMARFLFIVAAEWSCNKVHIGWCVRIKRCFLMYIIFQEHTSILTNGVPLNFVRSLVSHCRWRHRFYNCITDSNKNILEICPLRIQHCTCWWPFNVGHRLPVPCGLRTCFTVDNWYWLKLIQMMTWPRTVTWNTDDQFTCRYELPDFMEQMRKNSVSP